MVKKIIAFILFIILIGCEINPVIPKADEVGLLIAARSYVNQTKELTSKNIILTRDENCRINMYRIAGGLYDFQFSWLTEKHRIVLKGTTFIKEMDF